MNLDPKILQGKKPLTCFDVEIAKQFIGKECYFSDYASKYEKLEDIEKAISINYSKDVLTYVNTGGQELSFVNSEKNNFRYCLPAEWVEETKEPKYRPYTIKDFEKAFLNDEFEDFIIMRQKQNHDNVYTLRYNGNFISDGDEYICLGARSISFRSLFENYEVADYDGNWQPFGIEEQV